jgi:hypothetical protein
MENKKRDDTATLTAKACDCQPAYVRMIINGVRNTNTPKAKAVLEKYNEILAIKKNMAQPIEYAEV